VHAHITGNGGNGCTTKVCIINRKQHVEGRERGTANSYRRGVLAAPIGGHVTSPGHRATV
jgi:hypothetical protein